MPTQIDIPESVRRFVNKVGGPVTPEDVNVYGRLQDIRDRSRYSRAVLRAWEKQQEQDRKMRQRYAWWLMAAMGGQVLFINVMFVLLGCSVILVEPWTARTFILAVFAEIAALVLWVVKYLFAPQTRNAPWHGSNARQENRRGDRF